MLAPSDGWNIFPLFYAQFRHVSPIEICFNMVWWNLVTNVGRLFHAFYGASFLTQFFICFCWNDELKFLTVLYHKCIFHYLSDRKRILHWITAKRILPLNSLNTLVSYRLVFRSGPSRILYKNITMYSME